MFSLELSREEHDRLLSGIQLLEFRSPYDHLVTDIQRDAFGRIAGFKVDSYKKSFPRGILPFGSADLIADHFLICRKTQGIPTEFMCGVKFLSARVAEEFRQPFPSFELGQADTRVHRDAIDALWVQTKMLDQDLLYAGSWTIAPAVREQASLSLLCYRLTAFLVQQYVTEQRARYLIAFANRRFKVQRFHEWMGFGAFKKDGVELPVFKSLEFFGDPMSLSIWDPTEMNLNLARLRKQYADLWTARTQVSTPDDTITEKRAA